MFLIITPQRFSTSVNVLKTHKERTGMLTTVITLEDIYRNYSGVDEAEKVKRCIHDFHQRQWIRYALLVGDSDTFPVRYTKTDRGDANAFNTAFYATDFYYAALYKTDGSFDDWNGARNNYFGELQGETSTGRINVDQVNLVPTIAVGRIPASSAAEVDRYVQKVIRYETNAASGAWARKAVLTSTHDWHADACEVNRRLSTGALSGYTNTLLTTAGSTCTGLGSLTASALTTKINEGTGIVGYIGHGAADALAIPSGWWGTAEANRLTNTSMPSIFAVAGCNTAEFATLPPYSAYRDINGMDHAGTNGGEVFRSAPPQPACLQPVNDPDSDLATYLTVRIDAGAVGYIGGNTGMQMSEPYEYFLRALPNCYSMGEAWKEMILTFYQEQGQPGSLSRSDWFQVAKNHQPWKFMLFGDPSLRVKGVNPGDWSRQHLTTVNHQTGVTPALAVFNNRLAMTNKAMGTNPAILQSFFSNNQWSPQTVNSGDRGTSHATAMAVFANRLHMVWKGLGDDVRIWHSALETSAWSAQLLTSGDRGTSDMPALAVFQNKLFMVWKGLGNDNRIWFSFFDGRSWSPQQLTSNDRGTSHTPALAVFQDKLYMVWKGIGTDAKIWMSSFNGTTWTPQQVTSTDRGTSDSPALAVYRNKLHMVWKGVDTDVRIWHSTFNGTTWTPQVLTSIDRGTSDAPALAVFEDKLFMAWKGWGTDTRIFYSYLFLA